MDNAENSPQTRKRKLLGDDIKNDTNQPKKRVVDEQSEKDIFSDDEPDYSWVAGEMDGISHQRLIDSGGAGEVHQVRNYNSQYF